jgi:hypothetical protein
MIYLAQLTASSFFVFSHCIYYGAENLEKNIYSSKANQDKPQMMFLYLLLALISQQKTY